MEVIRALVIIRVVYHGHHHEDDEEEGYWSAEDESDAYLPPCHDQAEGSGV
jgi:hypothetical protein